MSEYNMSHTGRELDDAINKVKSGYILPSGDSDTITENGTHPVRQYENAVVDVPNYEMASGSVTPSSNVTNITFTTDFLPRAVCIGCGKTTTTGSNTVVNSFSFGEEGSIKLVGVADASSMLSGSGANSSWAGCHVYITETTDGKWNCECRHYNNALQFRSGTKYQWFAMGNK